MGTQHTTEHPSKRLSSGAVRDFEEALQLVEAQLAHERALLVRHDALDSEELADWDAAMAQARQATRHAGRVYREEMALDDEAAHWLARLADASSHARVVARLREDMNAAEAALDDEAAHWLMLLADALEAGVYSGLAI